MARVKSMRLHSGQFV